MVRRTFFNVGQALFCLEEVDDIVIVYDCGGQNIPKIKKAIVRSHLAGRVINAVFISHYDRDHINGIYYLLQQTTVLHLFLPMVREEDCLSILLNYPRGSHAYEMTSNCSGFVHRIAHNEQIKIHYVTAQEIPYNRDAERNQEYRDLNVENIPREERREVVAINNIENVVPFGTPISFGEHNDWVYIPYNLKYMSTQQWRDFVTRLGLPNDATCNDVLRVWRKTKIRLKQELLAIGVVTLNTINEYSMTLYSGFLRIDPLHLGCLYTGDYDASKNIRNLLGAYWYVWGNIGIVQVPHHGSKNNWNPHLIVDNAFHIIPGELTNNGMRNWVDPKSVMREIRKSGNVTLPTCCKDWIV